MNDQKQSLYNTDSVEEDLTASVSLDEPAEFSEPEGISVDEDDTENPVEEKKILFMKAAQGYGMIFGLGFGYILSGILSELGLQAGKFECVILCMFAGIVIGSLLTSKKDK